jgi:hypothetical protein
MRKSNLPRQLSPNLSDYGRRNVNLADVRSTESESRSKATLGHLQMLILLESGGWRGRHRYRVHVLGRKEPSGLGICMMRPACQLALCPNAVTYLRLR